MREIDKIILHCSGTDINSYNFRAIKEDHMNNRGWSDIGYHYGIDWGGNIHILRPVKRPGAHVKGKNSLSIGICILGLNNFKKIQLEQTARLCSTLCQLKGLTRDQIRGHYEFNAHKTCPNFDMDLFKRHYMGDLWPLN